MKDYVLHTLTIPISDREDWERIEELLLIAAHEECDTYMDNAKSHFDGLKHEFNIDISSVEPRVALELPEPGRINLILRFPTPFASKWVNEQRILKRYLKELKTKQSP